MDAGHRTSNTGTGAAPWRRANDLRPVAEARLLSRGKEKTPPVPQNSPSEAVSVHLSGLSQWRKEQELRIREQRRAARSARAVPEAAATAAPAAESDERGASSSSSGTHHGEAQYSLAPSVSHETAAKHLVTLRMWKAARWKKLRVEKLVRGFAKKLSRRVQVRRATRQRALRDMANPPPCIQCERPRPPPIPNNGDSASVGSDEVSQSARAYCKPIWAR